ncbi:MAG: glycosyltransferase [Caldilineaceae bacterium]
MSTLTRRGGVESLLIDFLTATNQKQVQNYLLTTSSIDTLIQPLHNANISMFQPRRVWRYDPQSIQQMSHWLRKQRIQIVHSYNAFANVWGQLAASLARVPSKICGEHGTIWSVKPPMMWLDSLAYQRADLVIANSQASAKMLQLRYGISRDKIRVIYNPIPPLPQADRMALRKEYNIRENTLLVGSIGRLDTPKGFATLVDTAAHVLTKRNDVHFMIIGGGPQEEELRTRIYSHKIEDRFTLTGWRADARHLVQMFDLFVNTSIRESFGNVLIEASLAEVPVVAPNIDGIPEAVIDQQTGILLTPTEPPISMKSSRSAAIDKRVLFHGSLATPRSLDPGKLAEVLLDLLEQPERRRQLGVAGAKRARELFTIHRYIDEIENLYKGLIYA